MKFAISLAMLLHGSLLAVLGVVGHQAGLGVKPAFPLLIAASGAVMAICGGVMLAGRRCRTVAEYATALGLYGLAMQALIGWRTLGKEDGHGATMPIVCLILAALSLGLVVWLFEAPESTFGPRSAPQPRDETKSARASDQAGQGHPAGVERKRDEPASDHPTKLP